MKKASEFIKELREMIDEYGDLDCVGVDNEDAQIEFNSDDDDEAFVIS